MKIDLYREDGGVTLQLGKMEYTLWSWSNWLQAGLGFKRFSAGVYVWFLDTRFFWIARRRKA